MCPFETRTAHSHPLFGALRHKMTNDTKCRESLFRMDFKGGSRTQVSCAVSEEKSYEKHKCLSLVHLQAGETNSQLSDL